MLYGLTFASFGPNSDPTVLATLAGEAERAGWDGVFLSDAIQLAGLEESETTEPWIALSAMAVATETIRLGPIVAPLPRYHPWHLARLTASLDRLSHGRLILGVGLGDVNDRVFSEFGSLADAKVRGQQLDEALAILDGLSRGESFGFTGVHYSFDPTVFGPTPVQRPRVPIWVGWQWPNRRPLARAARWDGAVPFAMTEDGEYADMKPEAMAVLTEELRAMRDPAAVPLEMVGYAPLLRRDDAAAEERAAQHAAGATWLLEFVGTEWSDQELREAIAIGPPQS
jgi:alkanesulfonate monooxygenase SsuD/methylene tetrahydromethanopterin reductase-like flavin-dependent oxidoreductase (luciferase family)